MYAAREPDAPRVHDEWSDNVAFLGRIDAGDIEALARSADLGVDHGAPSASGGSVARRPRRAGALGPSLDELVVYRSTQVPHVMRIGLAAVRSACRSTKCA